MCDCHICHYAGSTPPGCSDRGRRRDIDSCEGGRIANRVTPGDFGPGRADRGRLDGGGVGRPGGGRQAPWPSPRAGRQRRGASSRPTSPRELAAPEEASVSRLLSDRTRAPSCSGWSCAVSRRSATAAAGHQAPARIRRPTLVDLSGVERFLEITAILEQDQEPTAEQWDRLFATPGYAVLLKREFSREFFVQRFSLAFKPSKKADLEAQMKRRSRLRRTVPAALPPGEDRTCGD